MCGRARALAVAVTAMFSTFLVPWIVVTGNSTSYWCTHSTLFRYPPDILLNLTTSMDAVSRQRSIEAMEKRGICGLLAYKATDVSDSPTKCLSMNYMAEKPRYLCLLHTYLRRRYV